MLEDPEFIAWANENIVVVVGHQGNTHSAYKAKKDAGGKAPADDGAEDPKAGDPKTGDAKPEDPKPEPDAPKPQDAPPADEKQAEGGERDAGGCFIYPGIDCAEHEKIHEDAKTGTPSVEFQGWPTSFMVGPDGTVERHRDDRKPQACMDVLADFQKKFKFKVTPKKWKGYLDAITAGDKAVAEGRWKAALSSYLSIDKEGKKLSSLQLELPPKVEALNAKVAAAFAVLRDDSCDLAAKVKAVKALRSDVSARLSTGPLPVVADLDAWLKANPAPAAAPPR